MMVLPVVILVAILIALPFGVWMAFARRRAGAEPSIALRPEDAEFYERGASGRCRGHRGPRRAMDQAGLPPEAPRPARRPRPRRPLAEERRDIRQDGTRPSLRDEGGVAAAGRGWRYEDRGSLSEVARRLLGGVADLAQLSDRSVSPGDLIGRELRRVCASHSVSAGSSLPGRLGCLLRQTREMGLMASPAIDLNARRGQGAPHRLAEPEAREILPLRWFRFLPVSTQQSRRQADARR